MRSRARRSWWALYVAGSALALAALSWISVLVCELERSELEVREASALQEATRLALWRMDSWFAPQLAIEVARLPHEYRSYSPQDEAYTRILSKIEPGEVLVPSPLLQFDSTVIELHFQVEPGDHWTSPQVPTGNLLDLAQAAGLVGDGELSRRRELLAGAAELAAYERLDRLLRGEETCAVLSSTAPRTEPAWMTEEVLSNVKERAKRAQAANMAPTEGNAQLYGFKRPAGKSLARASSPLVPLWFGGGEGGWRLCFVRRVTTLEGDIFQGFLVDWSRMEAELLALVGDLLPAAGLEPRPDARAELDAEGHMLATVPAALRPGEIALGETPTVSPAMTTLLLAWLVTVVALGAVGLGLRSSISYGEQRSRFASTVTHELRTPLTTFRMYSEMLAKDMVPSERRREYLATLERESGRLAALVDNVMAYSRLESGRSSSRTELQGVAELIERIRPALEARAREAGMELVVGELSDAGRLVSTDADVVLQILSNLVDNAAKYGRGEGLVWLDAHVAQGALRLAIRDGGEGVAPGLERAIFRPFDRGQRDAADPSPGVGLGLALSRGLARDLGGDLVLGSRGAAERGASFELSLPLAG